MKKKILQNITGCTMILLLTCCEWDSPPIRELNKTPLWQSERLYHDIFELLTRPHYIEEIPIHDGVAMVGYADSAGGIGMKGLDVYTGKQKWISDYHNPHHRYGISPRYGTQVGSNFYHYGDGRDGSGNSYLYNTHVPTGRLERTTYEQYHDGHPMVLNVLDNVMVSYEPEYLDPATGTRRPRFWINYLPNVEDRQVVEIAQMNDYLFFNTEGDIFSYSLAEDNGEYFLIYVLDESYYREDGVIDNEGKDRVYGLNAYNITKGAWLYQNKPCKTSGMSPITISGDLFFVGGHGYAGHSFAGLSAHNWKTGEEVWYLKSEDFNTSNYISFSRISLDVASNTLVTSMVGYMYGIDAITGIILWQQKGIGNAGERFLFHKGVAYSMGGDIYGFEVRTGEMLLKIECPSSGEVLSDGYPLYRFWDNLGLYATGEGKPILVTRNPMYAYAYEGVR